MNIVRSQGVEPADFEMWYVKVSAINKCQESVSSQENVWREKDFFEKGNFAAIRIAALIQSLASVFDAEDTLL